MKLEMEEIKQDFRMYEQRKRK